MAETVYRMVDGHYRIKEWTEWHTNMQRLLNLIHHAVEEDRVNHRRSRKRGNATRVVIES